MHAPIVESTVGLVHLLFKTGGVVGAFLPPNLNRRLPRSPRGSSCMPWWCPR